MSANVVYEDRCLEVIGAGFGRTGTSSLKAALEILGYQDTYHMTEVFNNDDQRFWSRVADKKKVDFNEVFKHNNFNYTASCDFPSAVYWREQLAQFPDAKVILTVRDPEKWYQSCCDTIFKVMPGSPFYLFGFAVRRMFNTLGTVEMMKKVIVRDALRNNWNKESLIKSFQEHNAAVIAECPKDKLLVYEVSQGWEPLCKFLNKPIPNVPFPNVNDTPHFQKMIEVVNQQGYVILRNWLIPGAMLGVAVLTNHLRSKQ